MCIILYKSTIFVIKGRGSIRLLRSIDCSRFNITFFGAVRFFGQLLSTCTQSLSVTIYVRGALAKYLPPTTVVIRRWWVKGSCVINCGIRKLISSKTRRERVENFRGPDWRPAIALVPLKLLAFLPVTDLCAIIIIVRQVRRYLYLGVGPGAKPEPQPP